MTEDDELDNVVREIEAIDDKIKILEDKKIKLNEKGWALTHDTKENFVRYSAKEIEKIETGPNTWKCLRIGVFEQKYGEEPVQIGSYVRNYSSFYNTFFPFKHKNGKWYALYSPKYTTTRVMELPSCKEIGGEENSAGGFCPTGFYVPSYLVRSYSNSEKKEVEYQEDQVPEDELWENGWDESTWKDIKHRDFGFVCGCVWGDDWSWKIQYLDLSQADKGIIKREEKFGYIWLHSSLDLKDSIDSEDFENTGWIKIACPISFNLKKYYKEFSLSDVLRRGYAKNDIENRKDQLLEILGGNIYSKLVDSRSFLFILNVRDGQNISEEIDRKIINGKDKDYMESLKGLLSLEIDIPCMKCRRFYEDNCKVSKKELLKNFGNCESFDQWDLESMKNNFDINILATSVGLSSTFIFDEELKDNLKKLKEDQDKDDKN